MSQRITVVFTPAQLRMVNRALAREEAEDHERGDGYHHPTMRRTREVVWEAMDAAKIKP